MDIYLVGGCVRDRLLGLPINERDWVVVGGDAKSLLSQGYQQVGKDFPVFLHPETKEEYALARTERKINKGYYGFECNIKQTVTLEEDLQRRDLTINAIAQTKEGQLIDPFYGQVDLKNKILRHVSVAFSEDPVRVLRVARFAARFAPLGFRVAEETQKMMQKMVRSGEVDVLVAERVWKEIHRALSEKTPSVFFETLRACGALKVLLPALDKLWDIPEKKQWHPEGNTGIHVMMVLDYAAKLSDDLSVRFAALCHDFGKGETPQSEWPSHHGHEERGVAPLKALCRALRVPNHYRDLAVSVCRFHLLVHRVFELKPKTIFKVLEGLDVFRDSKRLEPFLLACMADRKGRLGQELRDYPQADFIREAFCVAKTVSSDLFLKQGFEGVILGEKIRQARILAIDLLVTKRKNNINKLKKT